MADLPDYDLLRTPNDPPHQAPPRRPVGLWIVVAALVAASVLAAYIVFGGRQTLAPVTATPERVEATQQPVQPLGGDAEPIFLPPLDQSDPLVRELVKQITSHPRVAAWLATDELIRTFTVTVANIAEGMTPARHLHVLRPSSGFRVSERAGHPYIDPRAYERYDTLADAAASIDPAGAARLYSTLKPRIEEAYRDLGAPGGPFDRTLARALVSLLETPVPDGAVPVSRRPQGIGYEFVDRDLEALTAAQKQLLRTGPRNTRIIQSALRDIALALGIPVERLPRPRS